MTGPTDPTNLTGGGRWPGVAPVVHDIRDDVDAARFGLQPWERDALLTRCIPDRDGARPAFIFCHIQEGSTVGSLEHFVHGHYPNGQRVAASCTVTIQRDGSILRVIPEDDGP